MLVQAGRNVRNFKNCKDKCSVHVFMRGLFAPSQFKVILTTSSRRSGIRCHASFIIRQRHRTGEKVTVKQFTMKRVLFFVALCCAMLFQTLNAQDIIVTKQSTRIDAKILEISANEVRYKKASNLEGPTFVLSTSEIVSILFANGEVQNMDQSNNSADNTYNTDDNQTCMLYRHKDLIVSSESNLLEVEGLKELLGKDDYSSYLSAQRSYRTGAVCIEAGYFAYGAAGIVLFTVSGARGNPSYSSNDAIVPIAIGGVLFVVGNVLLPVGFITKGVAAGRISRIAEGYNATHNKGTELSLSMSPTLMNNHGQIAPGVGLTLRF